MELQNPNSSLASVVARVQELEQLVAVVLGQLVLLGFIELQQDLEEREEK